MSRATVHAWNESTPLAQEAVAPNLLVSIPTDLGRPFATWSLAKLADYLVAEGVVTDISHEGLRQLLREEGVSFQAVRSWKRSNDPTSRPRRTASWSYMSSPTPVRRPSSASTSSAR